MGTTGLLFYLGADKLLSYLEMDNQREIAQDEDINMLFDRYLVMSTNMIEMQNNIAALHMIEERRLQNTIPVMKRD